MKRKILHYIVLPALLIGSDLFIGFMGHFAGSTGNNFTWGAFINYIETITWDELVPIILVAVIVVLLVEYIVRRG